MNKVENALDNVMTQRIQFTNITINTKVKENVLTKNDVGFFLDSLAQLSKVVCEHKKLDYTSFIVKNAFSLEKLKSTLVSNNKEFFKAHYDDDLIDQMKSQYDRLFITIRYKQILKGFENKATTIFTNFVKGITYFQSEFQITRNPIYHRNASCGSSIVPSVYTFSKTLYGPDKSSYIQRCYVERLVYDKIYEHVNTMQNLGHKHELEEVSRIYDSYFPINSIKINEIKYYIDFPVKLVIGVYHKDALLYTETYTKSLNDANEYKDNVLCYKDDFAKKMYYEKVQTFASPSQWIQKDLSFSNSASDDGKFVLSFD